MKKLCTLLLTVSLLAGVLGGCGGKKEDSTSSSTTGSESEGGVIELTFYNADGQEDPSTDPVALELTEKTGVKLKTE